MNVLKGFRNVGILLATIGLTMVFVVRIFGDWGNADKELALVCVIASAFGGCLWVFCAGAMKKD